MTCRITTVALALLALTMSACEDKSAPPSGSSSRTPLGGLADSPNSIPGKSAAMGRDVAAKVQGAQDAAANAANQINGQSAGEVVVGGLKFSIPAGWKSVPPANDMVKATYMIAAGGANAQCNFSTAGGDVASNLNRWRTQITDSSGHPVEGETVDQNVNGVNIIIFKATGTYATMSGPKQPGTAFRGAIIKAPAANVFIRLTAPAASIDQVESQWESMISGFTR